MNNNVTLEIAAFTLDGALSAFKAGAHRIELCENPKDGGTTPSYGMLKIAREKIPIPIFPIIRPRGGHFVYSNEEFEVMKQDIKLCKELGFEGVVLGILNSAGEVDVTRTRELVELASPLEVTFHRAFDRSNDPSLALENIVLSGCTRILTSGQFPNVMDGIHCIQNLVQKADNRIIIMPGSGVNSKNINELLDKTKATEFHAGARKTMFDQEIKSPLSMNEQLSFTGVDELEIENILLALAKNKTHV